MADYPLRRSLPAPDVTSEQHIWNWAQNAPLGPQTRLQRPQDEEALRHIITHRSGRIRPIGTTLSTGDLLAIQHEQDTLIDISGLTGLLRSSESSATFAAGTPLNEVYETLKTLGRMLPASPGVIAIQTLAGAIATGTHGQGLGQGALADDVLHIRLLCADGTVAEFDRDHPWFGALQLGLGCLGVMTEITLRTVPLTVFTCFKSAVSAGRLQEEIYTWNKAFTFNKAWWFPEDDRVHVWCSRAATPGERQRYRAGDGDAVALGAGDSSLNATVDQTLTHMQNDTRILGEEGRHFDTVTRFKDFTDVTGDIYQLFCRGIAAPQINVEIGIPLARAGQTIALIKQWYAEAHPHMHYPVILRCTGPSSAWLSPAWQQPTCFFGFVVYYADDGTLSRDGIAFLQEVEKRLAAQGGRPHWGKYYHPALYRWRNLYSRWDDFRHVRAALDPTGAFSNAFTDCLLEVR
ncbi:D-arabinono-1,4-lactone oxidase [Candidatus Sodalis sp. SoCistrobi]|uniref:D-arabinono-1,4-lactone oxidase n=1 Tax=Candidatus Sodalis sp. SoCistrobi TaxID=1922216 RepID=UPI000939C434|nr:D-arabinono-1,4-lactone oxidase [Candidatus Sodalis sp. SoCistrobi]